MGIVAGFTASRVPATGGQAGCLCSHCLPFLRPGAGAAIVGYAGDAPVPILFQEAEDVRAPVMHFSADQEVVVRPDHGDVIVNADERIVEPFFQARCSSGNLLGKVAQWRVRYLVVA